MDFLRRILPPGIKNLLRPAYHGVKKGAAGLLRLLFRLMRAVLGERLYLALVHAVADQVDTTLEFAGIRFDASDRRPAERAFTILSKEPDTINWIERYIGADDVLYDIGANIGVYSLYASRKRGARVLAFEPMCSNYDILNRNIFLNGLGGRITAYNIAFNDDTRFATLHLSGFLAGKSGHTFEKEDTDDTVFEQGMFGISVDSFVFDFGQPFPTHIKIDVDGNEPRIVKGMARVLADPRLKSVAIELSPTERPEDQGVIDAVTAAGFRPLTGDAFENTTSIAWTQVRNHFFERA